MHANVLEREDTITSRERRLWLKEHGSTEFHVDVLAAHEMIARLYEKMNVMQSELHALEELAQHPSDEDALLFPSTLFSNLKSELLPKATPLTEPSLSETVESDGMKHQRMVSGYAFHHGDSLCNRNFCFFHGHPCI